MPPGERRPLHVGIDFPSGVIRRHQPRYFTSLLNDPQVGGLRIDVDTFKGVVTLSGAVKTAAERDKAVTLARQVKGVSDVKSTLQITP